MCGIAGILGKFHREDAKKKLKRMITCIRHRGPDGEGYHATEIGAIAHCRLSIVDPANGHQPMSNEDETVWITCNGEIYNAPELRATLIRCGHRFATICDIEVIIHAYEEYGVAFINKLNGMFAFCLVDQKNEVAILARDRFGIKPLYYAQVGGGLVFASEISAFTRGYGLTARLNPEAIIDHFTFQYTLGDKTWYRGINMLEPGHYGVFRDGMLSISSYWDFQFMPEEMDETTALELLDDAFGNAVKRHLISDVPLGSYLSGGNDSSLICQYASMYLKDLKTFTCGFDFVPQFSDERCVDEKEMARMNARFLNTEHHELDLTSRAMIESIGSVASHLEEPMAGISYQIYLLSEFVGRHVKVVLTGIGGDELFGGYTWRYREIDTNSSYEAFRQKYYAIWTRLVPEKEIAEFFSPDFLRAANGYSPKEAFFSLLDQCNSRNYIEKAHYYELKTFLRALLFVEDKLSMAHSIESRVPFLDNEIVDAIQRIPLYLRYDGGSIQKRLLTKLLEKYFPQKLVLNRKLGFTPPDATWFRTVNQSFLEMNISRCLRQDVIFNKCKVNTIFDEFIRGRSEKRFLFWTLLMTSEILSNFDG